MWTERERTAFILLLRDFVLPASARGILADNRCLSPLKIQKCLVQGERCVGVKSVAEMEMEMEIS